eukprot:403337684
MKRNNQQLINQQQIQQQQQKIIELQPQKYQKQKGLKVQDQQQHNVISQQQTLTQHHKQGSNQINANENHGINTQNHQQRIQMNDNKENKLTSNGLMGNKISPRTQLTQINEAKTQGVRKIVMPTSNEKMLQEEAKLSPRAANRLQQLKIQQNQQINAQNTKQNQVNNQKYYYKPTSAGNKHEQNHEYNSPGNGQQLSNNSNELLLKDQIVKVIEKYIIPPSEEDDDDSNSGYDDGIDRSKIKIGQRVYFRGKFLGKGGFARCYEFVSQESKETLAAKIIDKQTLQKLRKKQKIQSEIQLHRQLIHPNIVKFEHFFEDEENVYMLLELCENQTLADLMRKRWFLSEFEVRYYLKQLICGLNYMHSSPFNVLHRDLKLGNLFLDKNMQLKIGDFGLATKLKGEIDLRSSICGTPNYMAPEILQAAQELQTNGGNQMCAYSFAADVWAVGVIMYTLVIGRPPFETPAVEDTYKKIKNVNYTFPTESTRKKQGLPPLSYEYMELITLILQRDPKMRPSLDQIIQHQFFQCQPLMPLELPIYSLSSPLSQDFIEHFKIKNPGQKDFQPLSQSQTINQHQQIPDMKKNLEFLEENLELKRLELEILENLVVVQRWADYTQKYGMGYKLSNNTYSVLFNDSTSVQQTEQLEKQGLFTYIPGNTVDRLRDIVTYNPMNIPKTIEKKYTLLNQFKQYIQNMELKNNLVPQYLETRLIEFDSNYSIFVKQCMQNEKCVLFIMSNDQIQAHYNDSSVMILDRPRKCGIFFSPKQPKIPYTFSLINCQNIKDFNSSAAKRFDIIQALLKAQTRVTPKQNYQNSKQRPQLMAGQVKSQNIFSCQYKVPGTTKNNIMSIDNISSNMRHNITNSQLQQQDKENDLEEAQKQIAQKLNHKKKNNQRESVKGLTGQQNDLVTSQSEQPSNLNYQVLNQQCLSMRNINQNLMNNQKGSQKLSLFQNNDLENGERHLIIESQKIINSDIHDSQVKIQNKQQVQQSNQQITQMKAINQKNQQTQQNNQIERSRTEIDSSQIVNKVPRMNLRM